jgi:Tol biopolymer transport system component
VLYEMLTGTRPFDGENTADTLSAVLRMEPDWMRLPPDVPSAVRRLLQLCLEKNARNRRSDATDVRLDIDAALKEPAAAGVPAIGAQAPARQTRVAWIAATLATLVAMGLAIPAVRYLRAPLPAEMRPEITTPATAAPLEFALSPDGQKIAFIASGNGAQRLWLRSLDTTDAQPLPGTEGADYPFWSPESRSIGFFASGKLYRIDIRGGPPQFLASANTSRGGTWNANGTIVFSPAPSDPLMKIGASGGTPPVALTKAGGVSAQIAYPHFLPDGHRFVFSVAVGTESTLYLGSLDGGDPKRLADADSSAEYLAPGFLVFRRQTALVAQHLDLSRGELTGEPVTLADPVGGIGASSAGSGGSGFSVSDDGRVAYRSGGGLRQLTWVDRTGKAVAVVGAPDSYVLSYPELSPDGAWVAVQRGSLGNLDVWLMDVAHGGLKKFTSDPARDTAPLWSHDSQQVAFASTRKGGRNLYARPFSGAGAEAPVWETPNDKIPRDWSHVDGRFLLYSEQNPKTGQDLLALPMAGADRTPVVVANTPADESNGQFSPDDRWVAYEMIRSDRFEIVVQSFPQPNGTWQVSTNGGTQPRWSADSKELYFIAADGMLMAAPITVSGAAFLAGTPVALFPAHVVAGGFANKQQYAVARDRRFLMVRPIESAAAPITLLLNWRPK